MYSDAENAPNQWRTWYIIFSLLLGFVFIGIFIFHESRAQFPLMPLAIWKVPQFAKVMIVIALGFSCFTGFLGLAWSLWFQQIDRASPITVRPSLTYLSDQDHIILFPPIRDWSTCKCSCRDDNASS